MNVLRHCLALFAAVFLFVGCSSAPQRFQPKVPVSKPQGARLTSVEVIRIAKQAAKSKGVDFRQFEEPKYEFTSSDRSWSVFFRERAGNPGGSFLVIVDDETAVVVYSGYG